MFRRQTRPFRLDELRLTLMQQHTAGKSRLVAFRILHFKGAVLS